MKMNDEKEEKEKKVLEINDLFFFSFLYRDREGERKSILTYITF